MSRSTPSTLADMPSALHEAITFWRRRTELFIELGWSPRSTQASAQIVEWLTQLDKLQCLVTQLQEVAEDAATGSRPEAVSESFWLMRSLLRSCRPPTTEDALKRAREGAKHLQERLQAAEKRTTQQVQFKLAAERQVNRLMAEKHENDESIAHALDSLAAMVHERDQKIDRMQTRMAHLSSLAESHPVAMDRLKRYDALAKKLHAISTHPALGFVVGQLWRIRNGEA